MDKPGLADQFSEHFARPAVDPAHDHFHSTRTRPTMSAKLFAILSLATAHIASAVDVTCQVCDPLRQRCILALRHRLPSDPMRSLTLLSKTARRTTTSRTATAPSSPPRPTLLRTTSSLARRPTTSSPARS